jgi:excinuclease UvrABC helicase subunit UvrB
VISNEDNINFISDISIVPTWGMRRNIGNYFNYEAGFGIGYVHYFEEDNVILLDESGVTVNLHLRIGYRF